MNQTEKSRGVRTGKLPSPILIALSPLANRAGGSIVLDISLPLAGGSAGNCDQESAIKTSGERDAPQMVVSEGIQPNASSAPAITACPHACNFPVLHPI